MRRKRFEMPPWASYESTQVFRNCPTAPWASLCKMSVLCYSHFIAHCDEFMVSEPVVVAFAGLPKQYAIPLSCGPRCLFASLAVCLWVCIIPVCMLSTATIIYLQVWIYYTDRKTRLSMTPVHRTVQEGLSMVSCREGITKSKHVLYWKLFTPNLCPWGLCKGLPGRLDWFLQISRNQSSHPGRPWGFCKGLPGQLDWFLQISSNQSSQLGRPWQSPQGRKFGVNSFQYKTCLDFVINSLPLSFSL